MASSVATPAIASSPQVLSLSNASPASAIPAPSSAFFGCTVKRSAASLPSTCSKPLLVNAKIEDEAKQTTKDKWAGLAYDTSDDQQDITRGKGMVDALFQGAVGQGTQHAVLSSYEYISSGQRFFKLDNMKDGYYIAPAFMDKLVVHIAKNFMDLPNIKVPLILGIWGGKGQGKSFQCELVFSKLGINPIMMSAGELESGNAGEPAKLIRQRYREAADIIKKKGQMCALFINDLDAGAGRMGGTTQYTVNNQMVNATLMNIADNPTNVQLPGVYTKEELPRVPIIVTGNDFSTLYAPLIRDGRMEKFYWAPTREDRIGVCEGIFRADNVHKDDIVKLVDTFPGQSIDFFGALRARVYDDEVRKWVVEVGVENMGKKLVNSREGPPTFQKPAMTVDKLLEYGSMLVKEQENVKRVQLAEKYLSEAALGEANEDAIKQGTFFGSGAQKAEPAIPAPYVRPVGRTPDSIAAPVEKPVEAAIPAEKASPVGEISDIAAAIETPAKAEEVTPLSPIAEEISKSKEVVEAESKLVVEEEEKDVGSKVEKQSTDGEAIAESEAPIVASNGGEAKEVSREVVAEILTDALRGVASAIVAISKSILKR